MKTYLAITGLGTDHAGLVDNISELVLDSGCNIETSRMAVLGAEFAVLMLVAGNWNNIAKLESLLPSLQKRMDFVISTKRTDLREPSKGLLPYAVEVVALDHPGIVYNLAKFFSTREVNIEELSTSSYSAAHTGSPMFSVHMEVSIPSEFNLAELREAFMDFCDQRNLDAVLEPIKN